MLAAIEPLGIVIIGAVILAAVAIVLLVNKHFHGVRS